MIRQPSGPFELSDDMILSCIKEAYTKLNFTGLVGWHYYNEPMLQHNRIFSLMERYPKGRYVLWTNGTIQPRDSRINLFEQVHCSDYTGINREYFKGCKDMSVQVPKFDSRLKDPKDIPENDRPCWRQYTEFILDTWGTAHLCCQDWRGEIKIGNIYEDSFFNLVRRRYDILKAISSGRVPLRCRKCVEKVKPAKFDKRIRSRIYHEINKA